MEGPRPPLEHELDSFITFLSQQLRPNVQWSIADEYPLAITSANLNNIRVMKSEGRYVSAAVMKPLIVRCPAGLFKVAAIGSVVTDPSHRNQGLSRQILEECLVAARLHGCDLAILWTNLYDFYRKIGFEMAGSEMSFTIDDVWPEESTNLRFHHGANVDPDAILRLYSQHTCGTVRTAGDIRKFLKIPNAQIYTAWNEAGQMQAFAAEGKGVDLGGYIHEWGGGVSKVLPLLRHIRVAQNRPITVLAPAHAQNFNRQITAKGAKSFEGILGMIRILNVQNVLFKVKRYTRSLGFDGLILEPRDGRYYLGYLDQVYSTDSEADLIRLIFGPQKPTDLHAFEGEVKEIFEKIFPIPLWVWGWDSV